MFLTVTETNA